MNPLVNMMCWLKNIVRFRPVIIIILSQKISLSMSCHRHIVIVCFYYNDRIETVCLPCVVNFVTLCAYHIKCGRKQVLRVPNLRSLFNNKKCLWFIITIHHNQDRHFTIPLLHLQTYSVYIACFIVVWCNANLKTELSYIFLRRRSNGYKRGYQIMEILSRIDESETLFFNSVCAHYLATSNYIFLPSSIVFLFDLLMASILCWYAWVEVKIMTCMQTGYYKLLYNNKKCIILLPS